MTTIKSCSHQAATELPAKSDGFAAVSRPDARVLVLGTLPGQASLARGEYYAHPRNQFWPIVCEVFGAPIDLPYQARLQLLLDQGIALWDVCATAHRPGSLDTSIEGASVITNDFGAFFASHSGIVRVCLNGQHASKLYQRLVLKTLSEHLKGAWVALPSTSPANAGVPYEAKRRAWRGALL
ncbi:DNA-deoxyinosine glycosylase [Ramlibacter monticola]|uniref:DNA-deoxyinosine glycosylase n=1 Tax=Ramlibacter monticola TaxID=1926872 RepID=A0A936YX14_9BURK|nr:DNA-deoxyinosine glycosylase [Ramlibacter monticola]MBL0390134.1 DNA-deoxyinosine glycosylase [Ramlibacter monticola]